MSLPGDRRIDTDPTDDPEPIEIIQDVLGELFEQREAIADAHKVLADEDPSLAAQNLALRTLQQSSQGYSQLLGTIQKQAMRLHEEVETLRKTDVA